MKYRVTVPVTIKYAHEVTVEAGSTEHAQVLGLHEIKKKLERFPNLDVGVLERVLPRHDDCGVIPLDHPNQVLRPESQVCFGGCSRGGEGPGCGKPGCRG